MVEPGSRECINHQLRSIEKEISDLEEKIACTSGTIMGDELYDTISSINSTHYNGLDATAVDCSFNEKMLNWLGYRSQRNHQEGLVNKENGQSDENVGNGSNKAVCVIYKPIKLSSIVPMDHVESSADGSRYAKAREQKSFENQIREEIKKSETMDEDQAKLVRDIMELLPNSRWNLYRLWLKMYVQEFVKQLKGHQENYRTLSLELDDLRKKEDIDIVRKAKIIGMTTTGAAKYHYIIEGAKPKITSK